MEINEDQYESLQTIFPDHAIDVFATSKGLTIRIWGSGDE